MLREFYEAVLPREGPYSLFLGKTKTHVWANSLDELVLKTENRSDTPNLYFATAAYQTPDNRQGNNVRALRSLRIDLDAGEEKFEKNPEKNYRTRDEALADVVRLIREANLKPTYIVSSGTGLHVYWCLDEDITPEQWTPLAVALAAVGVKLGMKMDSSVTTDVTRILRPPGALYKDGETRVSVLRRSDKIWSVEELRSRLPEVEPALPATSRPRVTGLNADVLDTFPDIPKSADRIAEHCAQMRHLRDTRGHGSYDYWLHGLSVIKVCKNADEVAEAWTAQRHEKHSQTDWHKHMHSLTHGPAGCDKFERANPGGCDGCPHKGKIKSPAVLGIAPRTVEEETQPINVVEINERIAAKGFAAGDWDSFISPQGEHSAFRVAKRPSGGYVLQRNVREEDEEGRTKVRVIDVAYTVFWFDTCAIQETSKDSAMFAGWIWDEVANTRIRLELPQVVLGNGKLFEVLADKSIHYSSHPKARQEMDTYVRDQLARIQAMGRKLQISNRLGPRILPSGELVVAHGKYIIRANNTIETALVTPKMQAFAEPYTIPLPASPTDTWGKDAWVTHVMPAAQRHVEFLRKFYGAPGFEPFRLGLAMGLASPLMAFALGTYHEGLDLPANALSVSLYSQKSGRGKTALIKAMMLAYGRPNSLVKESTSEATSEKARIIRLVMSGTMPTTMDEMGGVEAGVVTNIVRAVANGSGRIVATVEQGLKDSGGWALINLITTNNSIRSKIAETQAESNAIQNRLLEINVDNLPTFSQELQEQFEREFGDVSATCAGALGAVLHLCMAKMGAAKLNKMMLRAHDAVRGDKEEQEARFQRRGLAAVLVMHELLSHLRLSPFDIDELKATFAREYDEGVAESKEISLPTDDFQVLGRFLDEIKGDTLITQTDGSARVADGRYEIALNSRSPERPVARYVIDHKVTYVSADEFRSWCLKRKLNTRRLISAAAEAGLFVAFSGGRMTYPMDLSRGTKDSAGTRVMVYKVDLPKLWNRGVSGGKMDDAMASNVVPLSTSKPVADVVMSAGETRQRS